VIGGGDWAVDRLLPDVIRALVGGRSLEVRYPNAIRPWQHVLNPLEGYLLLAEHLWRTPARATAWNFGPDPADSQPVARIIERIADLWGKPLEIRAPDHPQSPEAPSLELDAGRARDELGWTPRWPLDKALRATVDWYRGFAEGANARELTLAQVEAYVGSMTTVALP
jgi:CDP-glucose 4,6-dehydratase